MTTKTQPPAAGEAAHTHRSSAGGVFYTRYVESADSFHYQVNSPVGLFVCRTRSEHLSERGGRGDIQLSKEANAIVSALNSSAQLTAAVDGVLWHWDRGDVLKGRERACEVLRRAQRNAKEDLS